MLEQWTAVAKPPTSSKKMMRCLLIALQDSLPEPLA